MYKYKDPAFLFYPESFLVGTIDMTDEEVGCYIRLLCRQHQQGHLSEKIINRAPEIVREKFSVDEEGKYYNERLEFEIEKRKKFTESRRKNASGKKQAEAKPESKPEEKKKDVIKEAVEDIIPAELRPAFNEWIEMRKKIKKPVVTRATVQRAWNRLESLSKRRDKQLEIIQRSIDSCWQSFYELPVKPPSHKEFKETPTREDFKKTPVPEEIKEKLGGLFNID